MLLVALGSNLVDVHGTRPLDNCRHAVERLSRLPDLRVEAVSRWYRSAPVPASDQPDYVNGVVRLCGGVSPEAMLARLHELEAAAGRVRTVANAARVLDLDLLAVDGELRDGPGLVLPHPRLAERAFVLLPLCDVAPDWVHPRLGRTARDLLAGVDRAGVELLRGQEGCPAGRD